MPWHVCRRPKLIASLLKWELMRSDVLNTILFTSSMRNAKRPSSCSDWTTLLGASEIDSQTAPPARSTTRRSNDSYRDALHFHTPLPLLKSSHVRAANMGVAIRHDTSGLLCSSASRISARCLPRTFSAYSLTFSGEKPSTWIFC